jgi:dTDP-4-dehydrorhamnose reductase
MRFLITGATGQLGSYLVRELEQRGWDHVAWLGRSSVDLTDRDRTAAAFQEARPRYVLHPAALASVADCYRQPARAQAINSEGTALLAELSAETDARLIYTSTDLVFDGSAAPYREDHPPSPLSIYGKSKAVAEGAVLAVGGVVVRISLLFGPALTGRPSFFDQQVAALRLASRLPLFADEWRTALSLAVAATALVDLAVSDFTGLLHLGGPERMSRLEMGQRLARFLGLSSDCLVAVRRTDGTAPEPRPADVSLDSSKWRNLFPSVSWPEYEEALKRLAWL